MPAHALATAAVLTLSPPQLASLDQPTPTSSTGGPLDPLWHRLTHRSTPPSASPTASSATTSPGPAPTGTAASASSTSSPSSAASVGAETTPSSVAAVTSRGPERPAGAAGVPAPAVTGDERTQAASSERVASTSGSGPATSLTLTVLGMLVAAAAVAATTVRSWSRPGRAAPSTTAVRTTTAYRGRRRR